MLGKELYVAGCAMMFVLLRPELCRMQGNRQLRGQKEGHGKEA